MKNQMEKHGQLNGNWVDAGAYEDGLSEVQGYLCGGVPENPMVEDEMERKAGNDMDLGPRALLRDVYVDM